jgi:AcrR family transcriptional regulator
MARQLSLILATVPAVSDDQADAAAEAAALDVESKGERTRRRLLEIAIRQFGERGYRQTSVTDITREAGLTQAACYAYFGSKADLFREAVDTDAMDLIQGAAEQAAGHEPRQLLPALVLFLGGALRAHPLTERVLQGQEGESIGSLVDLPAVHEVGRVVAEGIRRGQDDGSVRRDIDPDAVAAGAEALILGLTISLAMGGGAATERHAFGVVSAFDAMLRPLD